MTATWVTETLNAMLVERGEPWSCEQCVGVGVCVCVFVGSCLATKVFIGNLPAMGRGWVIIK